MSKNSALFAVCFVAGLLGSLGHSLFVWACGEWGLTAFIGVKIAPALKLSWLYPQLIIGGLWGLGYFFTVSVPRLRRHWIRKGIWYSLLPSAYSLFYALPYLQNQDLGGLNLGMLTPLFIIVANLLWGVLTGFFTRLFWGR
ncbi:MAG TPA: hypothetical protein VIR78_08315 [Malonomonas sp.]